MPWNDLAAPTAPLAESLQALSMDDIVANCIVRGKSLLNSHATDEVGLVTLLVRALDDVNATSAVVGRRAARCLHAPSVAVEVHSLLTPVDFACIVQAAMNMPSSSIDSGHLEQDPHGETHLGAMKSALCGWLSAPERSARWNSSPALKDGLFFAFHLSSPDDESGLAHVLALLGETSRADKRRLEALRASLDETELDVELVVAMARCFGSTLRGHHATVHSSGVHR